MNALYKNLSNKSFKKRSAILLAIADIITMPIIYLKCTDIDLFKKYLLVSLKVQAPDITQVPNYLLNQFYPLYQRALILFFALFLVYHCVVYYFYQRGSEPCRIYVHFYSATAAIGSLLFIYSILGGQLIHIVAVITASLIYFYNGFAPKSLKAKISE